MPIEALDLAKVRHVGGDRSLVASTLAAGPSVDPDSSETVPRSQISWQFLEVVEWPVGEHAAARFGFGVEDALLHRIDVADPPSGTEVSIALLEYKTTHGVHWPSVIEVIGPTEAYRDHITVKSVRP
jgi:hypothetical protein